MKVIPMPRLSGRILAVLSMLLAVSLPAAAQEKVSLQFRWYHQFQFAGYYAALHQGYYREAGLDVTLVEGGPGVDPVADVTSGRAEFGVAVSSLVLDYLANKPVMLLGPVFQHSPNILLVRGNFERPADLIGAGPIALMGGEQDAELKAMFASENIPLHRIKVVPDENHLQDLLDGKVIGLNAYLSNEPFSMERQGIPYTVFNPRSFGLSFYGDVLFTNRTLADRRPDLVQAFHKASMKGWEYALNNSEEIIDLIVSRYNSQNKSREHLRFEAKVLTQLINPDFIAIGHNNPNRWRHIIDVYRQLGMVNGHDVRLEDFFFAPDREIDLGWLYLYFGIVLAAATVVGGIAFYISRTNRRLAESLRQQEAAQKLLQKSEQRHRVIFQNSASAGIVWREGCIITDWNQQAEAVFGWTREEVIGRSFMDFLIPESLKRDIGQSIGSLLTENTLPHAINENLTRDGRTIICEWFNTLLPEQPGQAREMVSLAIDITERKKLEDALIEAKEKAESATRAKSSFLANMSHEIRTPMNGIIGMAYLALQSDLTQQQRGYLQKIESSAKSLLGILNDILDFSKIEAGKLAIDKTDFDLFRLVDGVVNLLELKAYDKGLELIVSYAPDMGRHYFGDSLRVAQVLTNLMSNAVKFTDRGEVSLTVHRPARNRVCFEVRDTGIGLTQDQQRSLFQSFSQADSSTTRRFGGTGLGLTISKQLVEMMNGRIEVTSEAGKGSCFRFEIELEERPERRGMLATYAGKKVLVVDDHPAWQEILGNLLRSFAIQADIASDGLQAIGMVRQKSYDLIMLDWQMPEMDGIETIRRINQELGTRHPACIMVSAFRQESIVGQAREEGIELFLQKPVNPSLLNDVLCGLFLGNQPARSVSTRGFSRKEDVGRVAGNRILLVEDNPINQEIVLGFLEGTGLVIDVADDGRKAVERFTASPCDLILMDIQMPVMDGFEATRIIRGIDGTVPIIALTANAMKEDAERTRSVGMNEHLNKPIDVERLYDVLLKYLPHRNDGSPPAAAPAAAANAALPPLQHIDTGRGLTHMAGNLALYRKVLRDFAARYGDVRIDLQDPDAHRLIHTLKGLSANIGATRLHELAHTVEAAWTADALPDLQAELEEVVRDIGTLEPEPEPRPAARDAAPDAVRHAFAELRTGALARNSRKCREAADILAGLKLPEAEAAMLDDIGPLLKARDYDAIARRLEAAAAAAPT